MYVRTPLKSPFDDYEDKNIKVTTNISKNFNSVKINQNQSILDNSETELNYNKDGLKVRVKLSPSK